MRGNQVILVSLASAVRPDAGAESRCLPLAANAILCYAAGMNAERTIFEQPDSDAEAAADARAEADIRAGRIVDHAEVAVWLAKWGTAGETAAPPEWLA